MVIIGKLSFIISLGYLAYQDFRSREYIWWLIPLLLASVLLFSFSNLGFENWVINSIQNLAIITFNLFMLTLYFSIKERKLVNLTVKYLGIGDVLFFVVCAIVFHTVNFIFFLIFSFTISLLISSVLIFFKKKEGFTIPLAGIMGVLLIVISFLDFILPLNLFYDPLYLINMFR